MRKPLFITSPKIFITLILSFLISVSCLAADKNTSNKYLENISVHGKSLDGNLEGNSSDRNVSVFLPPSYHKNKKMRYPVVYALHGYTANNKDWENNLLKLDGGIYAEGVAEIILVIPDAKTVNDGSLYASSVTVGDWESFIAEDLVAYIDKHYRTIASRDSRGLMGHSMGGHGTLRIGMKRPDVFSALYSMSPCCLTVRKELPPEQLQKLTALKSVEESFALGFFERATLATAAAWSPNPDNPPFFADIPGEHPQQASAVFDTWAANTPVAMLPQYVYNLKKYTAITIDMGDEDFLKPESDQLHQLLKHFDIKHDYEIYKGDHVNRVDERLKYDALPFFTKHLKK
jgi:S-formylglutathione hydrolase FrmB